jgi:hypothetical protein
MEQREGTKRADEYVAGLLLAIDAVCVKTEADGSTVWKVYIFDQSGALRHDSVRYTMGSAYAGKLPQPMDVLHSLVMDAGLVRHGQTFEEFCSEVGYDTDSRKAEASYNECKEEWDLLVSLAIDFDEAEEAFSDY